MLPFRAALVFTLFFVAPVSAQTTTFTSDGMGGGTAYGPN